MASKLKSDTARANGAKSRGPKSPATREKASHNSLRHGFTARNTVLLECENPDLYAELRSQYIAAYQPASAIETDLVDEMVVARWRIQRLWTIETALIDREMRRRPPEVEKQSSGADPGIHLALAFRALADESNSLALISRYESRLHRIHQRAYRTLRELRHDRKPPVTDLPLAPLAKNCQTNPPSPIANQQSPTTNQQSPIANQQSPTTNQQSPTTNQTPIQSRDREGADHRRQSPLLDSNRCGAFEPTSHPQPPTDSST